MFRELLYYPHSSYLVLRDTFMVQKSNHKCINLDAAVRKVENGKKSVIEAKSKIFVSGTFFREDTRLTVIDSKIHCIIEVRYKDVDENKTNLKRQAKALKSKLNIVNREEKSA